ncbi:MAG: hypothetical protein ACREMO_11180, partial [Gemmatimonadales bacterium]
MPHPTGARGLAGGLLLAVGLLGACSSDPVAPDPCLGRDGIGVLPSPIVLMLGNATVAEAREHFACGTWGSPVSGTWSTVTPAVAAVGTMFNWGWTQPVLAVGLGTTQLRLVAGVDSARVGVIVVPVPPVERFTSIRAGGAGTCATAASGAVYCWGVGIPVGCAVTPGGSPECGVGAEAPAGDTSSTMSTCGGGQGSSHGDWCSTVPVRAPGIPAHVSLADGGVPACGLTVEGTAACWGDGFFLTSVQG